MQIDWRAILGPALTVATVLSALAATHLLSAVPNPAPLFVCIVALAGSFAGLASSLACAALALGSSALFFSSHSMAVSASPADITRLSMLAVALIGTAILTGLLRKRLVGTLAWERRHHATAERLSAALDQVDIGIVLLNSDTRAEFINRAFRQYFALSDEKADSKPPFIALMYHGRDTGSYEMPEDELSTFIAQRTEMMRTGELHADQHQSQRRPGASFQLHGAAGWRTDAELYAGHRARSSHRRSRLRRTVSVDAPEPVPQRPFQDLRAAE